jgi:MFS superfamily sulfate permease-like transporter
MATQGSARPGAVGTGGSSSSAGEHEESHGHSLASWMLVGFELVGSFLLCLAIVITNIPVAVIGGVVCVVGLIVGRLLQMAGFGVHPPARQDS